MADARDAALRRLSRANRWLVAGSVALTGVFAEVAASAFPGKTVKTTGAGGSSKPAKSHVSKAAAKPIQPPAQAPKARTTPDPSAPPESPTQESAPSQESAPAQESAPSQESAPAQESVPAKESAPAEQSAPVQETAPAPSQESAPAQESSAPVVSGGS
jgi:outer membrane biosynthesis protein TonB